MATQHHTEEWRPVIGYEGVYEVSSLGGIRRTGKVRNRPAKTALKVHTTDRGYEFITLYRDGAVRGFGVHTLVAAAFIGPRPDRFHVNHKNGIKTDNRLSNLEYCTPKENIAHSIAVLGHSLDGEQAPMSKLTDSSVREIRRRCEGGEKQVSVARDFGVSPTTVSRIVLRRAWRHI